jgi:hypothetical protein
MYHLLHRRPSWPYEGVVYPVRAIQEKPPTEPEPEATSEEAAPASEPPAATDQEPVSEPEPVYTVIGEPVFPEPEAESTTILVIVPPESQPEEETAEPEHQQVPSDPAPRLRRLAPLGWMLAGFLLVLAGVLVMTQILLPWLTPSATITLVPKTKPISTTLTIHLVSGSANPARRQVPGRQLPTLTMSQEQTVPTTGSVSEPAQTAQGWITLYNALSAPQTILAGTLITGQDGIQVTIDTTVTIPAGNLNTNGHIAVSAHAVETGPPGNIAALDINGPCCRADVFAQNAAPFTGGQNARSYQAVRAQDIQRAAGTLHTTLIQQVTAAYQSDLHPGESLLTPVSCQEQVRSDHAAGEEATQVQVTASEACQGSTYQSAAMHALLLLALTQQAQANQETPYELDTALPMQVQFSQQGDAQPGEVQVQVSGTLVYHWTPLQVQWLAAYVASKSKAQAMAWLEAQPGVLTVTILLADRYAGSLPGNPAQIHIAVVASAPRQQFMG